MSEVNESYSHFLPIKPDIIMRKSFILTTKSFLRFQKFFSIWKQRVLLVTTMKGREIEQNEVFFVVAVKNHHHDCYYPLLHCMRMTELQCLVHTVNAIRESLQILLFIPRVIKSSSALNNTTENFYFPHRLLNGLVIMFTQLYHKRSAKLKLYRHIMLMSGCLRWKSSSSWN